MLKKQNYLYYVVIIIGVIYPINYYFFRGTSPYLAYPMYFFATIFLILGIIKNNNWSNIPPRTKRLIFFLNIWVLWLIISVIPAILVGGIDNISIKQFFKGILFSYISILIICVKIDLYFIRRFFKLLFIYSIFYLVITLPNISYYTSSILNRGEGWLHLLVSPIVLLLMTFPYHTRKTNIFVGLSIFLGLYVALVLARRNMVLFIATALFSTFLVSVFSSTKSIKKQKAKIILIIISSILYGSVFMYLTINKYSLFFERVPTMMESRDSVLSAIKEDLNENKIDWIIGKGIMGGYYYKYSTDPNTDLRRNIENGYYFFILKGGYILLVLILLVALNASYKGFFCSKNLLSKAFASYILIILISMIGTNQFSGNIKSILFFISISACFSHQLRNYSDYEIKSYVSI